MGPVTTEAGRYDDGSSDVPGGLVGPVERVVIVGAGIAGLTTASALVGAGVECVVLEARDRLGGRLHTIDLGGSTVDLGGSWIHHPVGNPLRAFADQVGVTCRPGDPSPDVVAYDCREGRRLSGQEFDELMTLQYETFPLARDRLVTELGPTASMGEAIQVFLDRAGLEGASARRATQMLRAGIEAESTNVPERQSLAWMWNEIEYEGGFFGDLPVGGYRTLIEKMAAGVDVRLGVEVEGVHVTDNGVTVRTAAGPAEEGSHAVVTVPLGVLKRGAPRFTPPLPADRRSAIDRLGFGRYEKIAMSFREPFWRAAGLPHLAVFPADPAEGTVWVLGQDAFGEGPVLVAYVFHSATDRVLDATPDAAAAWILGMYADAIGHACPEPLEVRTSSWGTDPHSFGSWTHITPEARPADVDLLGEPLFGRLQFAGEHTQSARLVYVDGAMASGIREAKRLLQARDVGLGPPAS